MIKNNYYFLGTALPPLQIGVQPDITFGEFMILLKENLTEADYRRVERIRWFTDLENIRRIWKGEIHDYWGNLDVNALEEILAAGEGRELPRYVYDYLDRYPTREERLKYFPTLIIEYFQHEMQDADGFLRKFYQLERDLRLVLVGFRARVLGRDLLAELQFEDPTDEIVAQLIAQKDAKNFEAPIGYEDLGAILEKYQDSPLELHKAIYEYRFQKIESMLDLDSFSIERIMGYFLQFIMVDKWLQLDQKKGIEIVDSIVKEGK